MFARRLLLRILASPMFLPVTAAVIAIPVGAVGVPLVEKALPGAAVVFPLAQVPEALAKWPALTPRLSPRGGTPYGDDRIEWRVESAGDAAQVVEQRLVTKRATRIVRYRATDAGVTLLTSRMFTRAHAWSGLAVGIAGAVLVMLGARRLKRGRFPFQHSKGKRPL